MLSRCRPALRPYWSALYCTYSPTQLPSKQSCCRVRKAIMSCCRMMEPYRPWPLKCLIKWGCGGIWVGALVLLSSNLKSRPLSLTRVLREWYPHALTATRIIPNYSHHEQSLRNILRPTRRWLRELRSFGWTHKQGSSCRSPLSPIGDDFKKWRLFFSKS